MRSTVLFFLFAVLMTASDAFAGKSPYPEGKCGALFDNPLKIVGFRNYPPFSWIEGRKGLWGTEYYYEGFIIGPVKESLKNIHSKYLQEDHFEDSQQIQKAMLRGKEDLSFSSYYIDEAKSGQDYIYPAYFGNPFIVVSRQNKKIDVNDISELKGLKGVIRNDEEIEALFRGILPTDTKMEIVPDAKEAFVKLLSGEADFVITSPYAAEAEARRFKIRDKIHFGNKVLRHIKYFIAFSKQSICRKYKNVFEQEFKKQPIIADKAKMEESIQKYIRIWEEKHKDEPPLEYTPVSTEE